MRLLSQALVATAAVLSFIATLTSAELEYCGNKYCGIQATCNYGKCECPLSQPLGDPAFQCVSDDTVSCVLVGDPSLLGFTGDLTFVDFPCKYTFSKFDTPLLSRQHNDDPPNPWNTADPGRDRCRVIVHGTNTITEKGSFFLERVNVIINFNIGGSKRLETLLVTLEKDEARYSYPPYGEQAVGKDDEHRCESLVMDANSGIELSLCYVSESNIWSLMVPMCGSTFINFRPWEHQSENQPMRPGVAITTKGKMAMFNNKENGYPATMCDSPFNDADDVYHDECKRRGLIGKRNCAFHAFLENNPPEQPHSCVTTLETFNVCSADNKIEAINKCGSIVTQFAKCVLKNDRDVMEVFDTCVAAICITSVLCKEVAGSIHHGEEDDECRDFKHPC